MDTARAVAIEKATLAQEKCAEQKRSFEGKFKILVPENEVPGRPAHLVIGEMIVLYGKDDVTGAKSPWVGKVLAIDGRDVRIHWYRSVNNKLKNVWTPMRPTGDNTHETNFAFENFPVIVDWGFSLIDKRIPRDRITIMETTISRLEKKYK